MRRLAVWCAVLGLCLGGCDTASKGLGGSLADAGGGTGSGDTSGGGGIKAWDSSAPGDGSGSDAKAPSDTVMTSDAAVEDSGGLPDTGDLGDAVTVADALADTAAPIDIAIHNDTASDAGAPQDTAPPVDTAPVPDTTTPEDTAPEDTTPADTGPPPPDPTALVITEIMYDPATVNDEGGEWIELLNTSSAPVDLVGLTISDSATPHLIVSDAPLIVPAGAYAVLARSADPAANGGVTPLYVFADFSLTNTGDTVALLDGTKEIDRVDYDESAGWPDAIGMSIQLDPTLAPKGEDNFAAAWCFGSTVFGKGDLGSPGAPNPPCGEGPEPTDPSGLVITEILYDPTAVSDSDGEWVELTNTGAKDVDLRGLTLSDAGSTTKIDGPAALLVPAGGRALVGKSADPAKNGGLNVLWTFGFGLNNDKDSVILAKDGVEIDRVDYDEGVGWPKAAGASIQLDGAMDPATADNAQAASWCLSTAPASSGDLGTPGTANTPCGGAPVACAAGCDDAYPDLGCYCDSLCASTGDCCPGACEACGYCDNTGSGCEGFCGGESAAGCYCDDGCIGFGDCCADACSACGICP